MDSRVMGQIVREEFAGHCTDPENFSETALIFSIRKRIVDDIMKRLASDISPAYRQKFFELEDATAMLNVLTVASPGVTKIGLTMEEVERVIRLFEQWKAMIAFLCDVYDDAPLEFQKACTRDYLARVAAYVDGRHRCMFESFGESLSALLVVEDLARIRTTLNWARLVILGSHERLQAFAIELQEAAIVVTILVRQQLNEV